jgi:endonuclease/exonuclease/phosphatase family metal-dependent hydrolase
MARRPHDRRLPAPRAVRPLVLALILGLLGVLDVGGASTAQAVTRPSAPSKVWVRTLGYGKFEAGWTPVSKNVTSYRVFVATDSAMTNVVFISAKTSHPHKWIIDPAIKEGRKYYFRVRAYNSPAYPGKFSPIRSVTTKVYQVYTPQNVKVAKHSPSSVVVSWNATERATGYTVKLRPSKAGTPFWTSQRTSATSLTVTGLTRHTFYVTVTADRLKKTFRDSTAIVAATNQAVPETGVAFTMNVASYNVMGWAHYSDTHPWSSRRQAAADLIDGDDLVGIQEATWGLATTSGLSSETLPGLSPNDQRQAVQLAELTSSLTLAMNPNDPGRPCSNSDNHLFYRTSKFDLRSCGIHPFGTDNRSATWAILKENASGRRFLAVNTHLTDGWTSAGDAERTSQAKQAVALIDQLNGERLPVVILGDLNSYYGRVATSPLSLFSGAGYYPSDLVADTLINGQYASTHHFLPTPTHGHRIDHIFTSSAITTNSFTLVKTAEANAPSDHHAVSANVTVYN